MPDTEQEYKKQIKELEQQVRYFEYQPGRGGKYPEAFLKGYTGYIHTDAYSGYNGVKGVTRCLCYTHLRRAFVDALPKDIHDPKASKPAEAVLQLNKLFEIEKELDTLPPEQKKKERLTREKPLLEAFWSWAEISSAGELPKSKLHTAIHYALNNRQEFFNYLEDGNCSISNSLAKNCIRPFVIGRKNWLFAVSPKGAAASAGIYTLVETAKANGLDAVKYIKYILSDQICQGVHSLKTQNIWMTIYHGTPWYRNVADNHCPFSIEGWWLFFYPLSYLTLTQNQQVLSKALSDFGLRLSSRQKCICLRPLRFLCRQ